MGDNMHLYIVLCLALGLAVAQDDPLFRCPEKNGFFPDPEQCEKYYECVGEVPEEKFCPDGLLFEASDPNSELCDYPFNVDCGAREYVQEPEPGLDARCYRANGFFNHEDPLICNKYYNCVHGFPHPYDCPLPLVFDEAQGTCVREEQASSFARPSSCRKYIVCEFSTTPKELGCTDGLVFDHNLNKSVDPEAGPDDCKCWYSCPENSACPDSCNTDCTCP